MKCRRMEARYRRVGDAVSEQMYRDKVVRLTKDRAELEKRAAAEADKLAKLDADIGRIERSITSSTSPSTSNSKARQIEAKQKQAAQVRKKLADLQGKVAQKASELNSAQRSLDRAAVQRQRKDDTEAKKRRTEEMRHARALTRETERRTGLFSDALTLDSIQKLPQKIKVLVLASNPADQQRLMLDEEVRIITEKVRASEHRESVDLISRWALRTGDLFQHLNEHQPHVVHFVGHGSDRDELAFHKDDGSTKLVSKEAIASAIAAAGDNIRLIVFNACYSAGQAEAATEHIDVAIGMNTAIGDEAAQVFAAQFYSAISFGKSVQRAFQQAKAQLLLEGIREDDTPELFVGAGIDPDEVVLVQPDRSTISAAWGRE